MVNEIIIEGTEKELAFQLVKNGDIEGIKKLTQDLYDKNLKVQSQSLKMLYETGYVQPMMIAQYCSLFITLLKSKNNRLVWGAMIALSIIANIKAKEIFEDINLVYGAMREGSVITIDYGVKVLATIAAQKEEYNKVIFPFLIDHLKVCCIKEVCQHTESILVAVNPSNKEAFLAVLEIRVLDLSETQRIRLNKILNKHRKEWYQ